jgi:hypothetical protein
MNDDIIKFSKEIAEKINARQSKKGTVDFGMSDAVREMVKHKLQKEGWIKKNP